MRTSAGISTNVSAGETVFTLIGFAGMYFLLGFLFSSLTLREIGNGPDAHPPENIPLKIPVMAA